SDESAIKSKLNSEDSLISKFASVRNLQDDFTRIKSSFFGMQQKPTRWKNFIPSIHFYPNNQYHRWLFGDGVYSKGLIRGELGISYTNQEQVTKIIGARIGWSLLFTLLSVILAYVISVPIGIWSGVKRNSFFDRASSIILLILYSMPAFWAATLLLFLFAN